jgi:hypothetical protein
LTESHISPNIDNSIWLDLVLNINGSLPKFLLPVGPSEEVKIVRVEERDRDLDKILFLVNLPLALAPGVVEIILNASQSPSA